MTHNFFLGISVASNTVVRAVLILIFPFAYNTEIAQALIAHQGYIESEVHSVTRRPRRVALLW